MIQANLLLGTARRSPDSYVILDLMRRPLGILTGVGFIGAGAIFRQDNLLRGVTTAATLWFVTVIGLCFGGGQIGLGIAGTLLGLAVLWGLKLLEQQVPEDKTALLWWSSQIPAGRRAVMSTRGYQRRWPTRHAMRCASGALRQDTEVPAPIRDLAATQGVLQLQWKA